MLKIHQIEKLNLRQLFKKIKLSLITVILLIASFLVLIEPSIAETYKVKMGTDEGRAKFVPDTVTINPGDTLKWINNINYPCNVVFNKTEVPTEIAEELSHKKLVFALGETFETNFPSDIPSGEYTYVCEPLRQANMIGKIIVK